MGQLIFNKIGDRAKYHQEEGWFILNKFNVWERNKLPTYIINYISLYLKKPFMEIKKKWDYNSYKKDQEGTETEEQQKKRHKFEKKRLSQYYDLIENLSNNHYKKCILNQLPAIFEDRKFNERLDKNPDVLPFDNCLLDLKTRQFRQIKPEDYISTTTGYGYEKPPEEDIEEFRKNIVLIQPNKETRDNLMLLYCSGLIGINPQTFNIFLGSGGNGKGQLNEIMIKIVGDGYYGCYVKSAVFETKRKGDGPNPELAKLDKKRFVIMSELSGKKINSSILKLATGGEGLTARKCNSNKTEIENNMTLISEANPQTLGQIDEIGDAIDRRVNVYPFKTRFKSKEKYDKLMGVINNNNYIIKEDIENEEEFKKETKDMTPDEKIEYYDNYVEKYKDRDIITKDNYNKLTRYIQLGDDYKKSPQYKDRFKLPFLHILIEYLEEFYDKKRPIIYSEEIKRATKQYLGSLDLFQEFFDRYITRTNNIKNKPKLKEIYNLFKKTDEYRDEENKRKFKKKDMKNYIKENFPNDYNEDYRNYFVLEKYTINELGKELIENENNEKDNYY